MRCFMCCLLGMTLGLGVVVSASVQAENILKARWTNKIDADPQKDYALDKAHGPWMVMVASFHEAGSTSKEQMGKSPLEAAQELVLEFRRLKPPVPAYVYQVKGKNEAVQAQDSLGRDQRMKNMRVIDSVCVLAGNYPTIDDPKAQKTLKFIKQFKPKCLNEGVDFTISPGRPGPLSKAFLTPNPLLSNEELESSKQATDALLIQLNNNEQFSLLESKGKYTLVVAKFSGKSINVVNESMATAEKYFKDGGNDLDAAAVYARYLVKTLRSREPVTKDANMAPYCRLDAYIWHDHTSSYVTVGSFQSPDDPAIKKFTDMFGPQVTIAESGRQSVEPRFMVVKKDNGQFHFIPFEPNLRLMIVPYAHRK